MKKVIIILLVLWGVSVYPQSKQKIGHIDTEQLLLAMPARDSAKNVLEKLAKELEAQIKTMTTELETKYQDYINNQNNYTPLIKATKERELQDLNQRIQEFQQTAQKELQNKEQELLQPIIDKAKKAIEEVAKENGYTYIFEAGGGFLLYFEKGDDILPLVKKKMNLK